MSEPTVQRFGTGTSSEGLGPDVVVNARFSPNGLIDTITHRPEQLSAQEWFDRLCHAAPEAYHPLAGGRGAFKIPCDRFDAIRRAVVVD